MVAPTRKLVEGKVAKILNNRELVINRGSDQGVAIEMRFKVMEPQVTVVDPDTDEELGSISREKIRVKIVHIEPKLAIARTYETYQVEEPVYPGSILASLGRLRRSTRVRTLSAPGVDAESYSETLSSVDIGDQVVQLDDDE